VPSEDGFGLDRFGHFLKRLLTQFLTDLSQGDSFGIAQMQSTCDLVAKDGIFRRPDTRYVVECALPPNP
jgi:hypothetical protein